MLFATVQLVSHAQTVGWFPFAVLLIAAILNNLRIRCTHGTLNSDLRLYVIIIEIVLARKKFPAYDLDHMQR